MAIASKNREAAEATGRRIEIVYRLHGSESLGKLIAFIESRVLPIREKYPYAEIRIEVNV